jgi:hypothetical protein
MRRCPSLRVPNSKEFTVTNRFVPVLAIGLLFASIHGCGAQPAASLAEANGAASLAVPDGIDPIHPNVERTTQTLDFSGVDTIRIELAHAELIIEQGNDATLKVTKLISATGQSKERYQELLSATSVSAQRSFVDSSRLDVTAELPSDLLDTDVQLEVRLMLPAPANIEALLGSGGVSVTHLEGNLEIETTEGEIHIDGVYGNVVARTSNHKISVADVSGNFEARTTGGDIELRLDSKSGARIAATADGGSIRISAVLGTSAAMSLTATDGNVSANLNGFSVSNVLSGDGYFNATLNSGAGRIEANTIGGDIEFTGIGQ